MKHIAQLIQEGATTFLYQEYTYLLVFLVVYAFLVKFCAEPELHFFYTTSAFLIGGLTSIVSGFVGMKAAVYSNVRTTKMCSESTHAGFLVAFRGGQVLGFCLVGLALLVLIVLFEAQRALYKPSGEKWKIFFEMLAGYGLGGSSVALFGRVGGGIYTKAADVGSDLAGKVVENLPEDDPRNPGVVADNVGDNVGDIAGMGADLFGSLAESTCAALVVSSQSKDLLNTEAAIYFPLMITATGILISFITTFFATLFTTVTYHTVERTLKWQLIISTILMTVALVPLSLYVLPEKFDIEITKNAVTHSTNWKAFGCVASGLWSGLIIGYVTEIYTSN